MNEYVIVRDLGQGSSAEVKLCQLVMPPPERPPPPAAGEVDDGDVGVRDGFDGSGGGGGDGADEGRPRHSVDSAASAGSAGSCEEGRGPWGDGWQTRERDEREEGEEEEGGAEGVYSDLYVSERGIEDASNGLIGLCWKVPKHNDLTSCEKSGHHRTPGAGGPDKSLRSGPSILVAVARIAMVSNVFCNFMVKR